MFLSQLTWNPKSVDINWDGTLQEQLFYNLDDVCFVLLKDNDEFIKLKKRLKKSNPKSNSKQ